MATGRYLIPSMRPNGSAVSGGHWRRSAGRQRPTERDKSQYGCCTFVLHVASSSRSQVAVRATCATAWPTWERPSVSVCWRPLLALAIVTQLVTRLLALARET